MTNYLNLDSAQDKTIVLTTHTRNFDFLSLQAQQLSKHVKFPYIFVAGIDLQGSPQTGVLGDDETKENFAKVSITTKTSLVQIPSSVHEERSIIFPNRKGPAGANTSKRSADSLQYLLSVVPWWKFNSLLVIDGDMFPIATIQKPLVSESNVFRGIKQNRKLFNRSVDYFWNGYFWIHNSCPFHHLLNFNCGLVAKINTDAGGETSYFLKALTHFGYPISYADHLSSGSWGDLDIANLDVSEALRIFIRSDTRNDRHGRFFSEIYDRVFFHYRAGGNWMKNNVLDEENRRKLLRQSLL